MENLEIFILTSIISTLFIVFGVVVYRELSSVDENSYKTQKEGGPRVYLFNLMAKLFEDEQIPKKEKRTLYKAVSKTIADMESDGVYFPDDVKEDLRKKREELWCEYSDLPSPKSYEN